MGRYQAAVAVGKWAYANRRAIKKTYRRFRKARSRRTKRGGSRRLTNGRPSKRARIGEPVGYATGKRFEIDSPLNNYDTRTFYQLDPLQIIRGDTLDSRNRDMINLRGIKATFLFKNAKTKPLQINWACVASKKRGAVDGSDWWRSNEGTSRQQDFDVNADAMTMHNSAINTDEFTVLFHKRFTLISPEADGLWHAKTGNGRPWVQMEKYVKINRQIRFEGSSSLSEQRISFVWYCTEPGDPQGHVAQVGGLQVQAKTVCFFKEPKCY